MDGFIETPRQSVVKTTLANIPQSKPKIKTPKADMNKEQYKKAKADHKDAIAEIKDNRKKLKQDIKKHKLLMKQARIMYKLGKMKGTK